MANITSQNEVTVSGLARVVEGIKTWVESSAAAHSAYRVHSFVEWGNVSGRPDFGNYVFDAKYVNGELESIKESIVEAASATSADMEVIAAALNDLDDRINATSGKADKVTGATAGHLAALDADGNLTDAGVTSGSFKTKQSTVSVTGSTIKTITSLTQDANGEVSATVQDIPTASTSQKGLVQLVNAIASSSPSESKAATEKAVKDAIDAAVSNAYHHAGTKKVAELTSSLLTADNEGNVYNITDSGTTTDLFIEGAGHPIKAGDNVGICKDGSTYKFDLLSGFVDLSGYKTKQTAITSAASNALQTVQQIQQNENGELTISYQKIQSATTSHEGVVQLAGSIGDSESEDGKAATPKSVRDAINALDVELTGFSGNETLGGISQVDGKLVVSKQYIQIGEGDVWNLEEHLEELYNNKQDNLTFEGNYDESTNKVATESTVSDAIEALDVTAISVGADKTLTSISETDGKISATPVAIQIAKSQVTGLETDLGKKADKVIGATSGHLAMLDENGNLKDSGSKAADFATAAQGAKADSAIQGVKLAGSALTPDANKVVDIPLATSAANGLMSSTDKGKLDAIQPGAEVNQNAFSNVKVGSTTVAADTKTDTLEIVTSGNVTVSANASNDTILIGIPLMDETDVNNILNLLN